MRQAMAKGLVVVVATLGVLATGCGGKDDQKSFEVVLQEGDTVQDIFTRSVTKAADMCVQDSKLTVVRWKFSKDDIEKPLAQEYTRNETPIYVECAKVRQQAGATTTAP